MSLSMPNLSLGDRVLRIADTQGSSTAEELRRVCAAGSQDAVLRALGEAALADAASEARGLPPTDAPETDSDSMGGADALGAAAGTPGVR